MSPAVADPPMVVVTVVPGGLIGVAVSVDEITAAGLTLGPRVHETENWSPDCTALSEVGAVGTGTKR